MSKGEEIAGRKRGLQRGQWGEKNGWAVLYRGEAGRGEKGAGC